MQDGLYVPSDLDVKMCESGKGCMYGICSECLLVIKTEENNNE